MKIETSARLHLSLIDLNGTEGRLDGGIGLTLQQPSLNIECNQTEDKTQILFNKDISTTQQETYKSKIIEATQKINNYLKTDRNYTFKINEIYPIHHGLGLGTQLALSVAKLIAEINNQNIDTIQLAKIINRGGTSGIGVYSFDNGGLIIDGGHKKALKKDFLPSSASQASPPPLIARYEFPEEWNIILATPQTSKGASGKKEINIFQEYTPINIQEVQQISHLTLMKLMPAIIEKDIENFGSAINKIQTLGFKKIERKLQNSKTLDLLRTMQQLNIPAVGMSSFGPTCFGITEENPKQLQNEIEEQTDGSAKVIITKGKNHGSILTK